jgi:Protein of unknown function (DUF1573)
MYGIFFFISVNGQTQNNKAYIKFKKPKYNFGFVREEGRIIKMEYSFENTGNEPLIISEIITTCGCTVADFPHYPVKQGEWGTILLTFDTTGKYDRQDRVVEVISNASNSPQNLRFKGVVLK